jgi:hypothetical protein
MGVAAAVGVTAALAQPASAATWQPVPLPSSVVQTPALYGVSAAGPGTAWAVGSEGMSLNNAGTPLIVQWTGRSWEKDALPVTLAGALTSVAAASRRDAWAVGGVPQVVLHWDGTAWHSVAFPGDQPDSASHVQLNAVAANRAGDAWLVGDDYDSSAGTSTGLIERWTGSAWVTVAAPAGIARLDGVQVTAAGEAWAAGTGTDGKGVVIHWNGAAWQTLADVPGSDHLNAVLAVSDHDVWAGGSAPLRAEQPFLEHWNGTTWDSPQAAALIGSVTSISADATGRPQWAGTSTAVGGAVYFEHFAAGTWTVVQGQADSTARTAAADVAHIPGTNATWAAGATNASVTPVPDSAFIQFNGG